MPDLQPLGETRVRLGESPVWDPARNTLYWVDTIGRTVYARNMASGRERSWTTPLEVGSIALMRDGNLAMALEDGFYAFDLASGVSRRLAEVTHPRPGMRMNDGKADRQGRFIAGSLVTASRADRDGIIYRLDGGRAVPLQSDIGVVN